MFIASLLLAATSGLNFPPPGDYRYTASMSGQNVGAWAVTVTQSAAGAEVDERSSAAVMGMQLSATAALTLGPDLAPTKYTGSYRTPTQNLTVSAVLTPQSATVVDALTNRPRQVALVADTRHFVVIEPGLLAGLFVLPAQLDTWKDPSVTWITPATAQTQSLTANAQASVTRPAGVPASDAVLSIDHPIAVTIWYDAATFAPDQISVPSQNAVLTRIR